jgi:hypothetical protein
MQNTNSSALYILSLTLREIIVALPRNGSTCHNILLDPEAGRITVLTFTQCRGSDLYNFIGDWPCS